VLRLRGKAFKVYEEGGAEVEIVKAFSGLKEGESGSINVHCLIDGEAVPLRICALRKDADSEQAGVKRLKRTNPEEEAWERGKQRARRHIIVATSLGEEVSTASVLELYRARWQIELAFKRLKSLFEYKNLPGKVKGSVHAWFYGKLLLAALCKRLVNAGRFFPLGRQYRRGMSFRI
jgi:hypothetical protein